MLYSPSTGKPDATHGISNPVGEYTGEAGPLVYGDVTLQVSCNLDAKLQGPCWGTFELPVEGGAWEGSWNGQFDLAVSASSVSVVGHGSGSVGGKRMKLEGSSTDSALRGGRPKI